MKKILLFLFIAVSFTSFGQIAKTGGLLYSNGNPNTKGIDTLVTKNLSKNSEVCVDYSTGTIYTFDRSDSSFVKYNSRPYKVYSALVTKVNDSTCTEIVLENTFNVPITLIGGLNDCSYIYNNGSFPIDSTFYFVNAVNLSADLLNEVYLSGGTVNIRAYYTDFSGYPTIHPILENVPVEIRVYD